MLCPAHEATQHLQCAPIDHCTESRWSGPRSSAFLLPGPAAECPSPPPKSSDGRRVITLSSSDWPARRAAVAAGRLTDHDGRWPGDDALAERSAALPTAAGGSPSVSAGGGDMIACRRRPAANPLSLRRALKPDCSLFQRSTSGDSAPVTWTPRPPPPRRRPYPCSWQEFLRLFRQRRCALFCRRKLAPPGTRRRHRLPYSPLQDKRSVAALNFRRRSITLAVKVVASLHHVFTPYTVPKLQVGELHFSTEAR